MNSAVPSKPPVRVKMKVLVVIPYFMPAISYGGPVRVSFDMAKGLVSRGHEVTVATTDAFDGFSRIAEKREFMDGIEVIRFRNLSNSLAKKMNGYIPIKFLPWLVRNGKKFDIVYCHDFFSLQTIATWIYCKAIGVPYIVQPHGSLSRVRRSARFSFIKNMFLLGCGSILLNAKAVVALTNEERKSIEELKRTCSSKIKIIPNGLDTDIFLNVLPANLHERYGIQKKNKIIGFVGRITYLKGLDISLEVLACLKNRCDITFLIIGPDEGEMGRLKKQAQALNLADQVVFGGTLDGDDKLRVMKACDLFLFTSRDEGLPMTVLEVAALGIPQVISAECNVPEVQAYEAGFVHPLCNIEEFSSSVEHVLNHPEVSRRMAQNAQRMVKEKFSADAVLHGIAMLIESAEI